jgi:nicotine blue oxidoreductase
LSDSPRSATTRVAAIVLAAGAGSRFDENRPGGKLVAELNGRPVVAHVLAALAVAPVDETVVVVGAGADAVRGACEPFGARVVENGRWAEGQSTSVEAGLRALGPDVGAAVVLLGDQPLVGSEVIRRLVAAFEDGARVAVATYGGRRRNPVLFARSVWPALLEELEGDEGARLFLRRRPELVVEVPCDGVGEPGDVDTVGELEELSGALRLGAPLGR